FAREVFHSGPEGLGVLQSAAGLGSIIGSLILGSMGDIRYKGRLMIGTGFVYGFALLGFGLSPSLLMALPFLALLGGPGIIFGSMRTTMIQLLKSRAMIGRVMSVAAL